MGTPLPIALPGTARELTDRATVAREGHRADFDALVRDHGPALYALAARMTAVRSDAEDLAQETLYRAWRSIHRFRGDANVRTWLYRILRNTHRSMWRRPSLALLPADVASGSGDPETAAARRDLLSRVLHAIDALPRRQRESLLLKVRGGLSLAEISDVMRIKRGAVKSHLVHARRKLFRRFGGEIGEWGIE